MSTGNSWKGYKHLAVASGRILREISSSPGTRHRSPPTLRSTSSTCRKTNARVQAFLTCQCLHLLHLHLHLHQHIIFQFGCTCLTLLV
ncbi:hypothetical protein QJS04_geneDACA022054 [Acorus gramineus]|uniref:Uncharacterized protein n=1 Tax=Acorus gramineus TaxID=55184 RepID=A0AAV9B4V1_ACOGR|nr:hypothetical protein QJS04_geneDACA022054 [Acorus gramineus]